MDWKQIIIDFMEEKMNNNLFKKLNEQMEINSVKNKPVTETEIKKVEENLIFKNFINDLKNKNSFTE